METKEIELSKFDKVKKHIRKKKAVYIGTVAGFATGIIVGIFAFTRKSVTVEEMIADMANYVKSVTKYNYKPTTNTFQTISQYGNVIGRPGKKVIDTITGKEFGSETLAAQAAGVSVSMMSNHLNGKRDHINGRKFILKLDE